MSDSLHIPAGFCPHCDYAMNPGICPECGREISEKTLASSARPQRIIEWNDIQISEGLPKFPPPDVVRPYDSPQTSTRLAAIEE